MQRPLLGAYFDITEHERVVADPQCLAADSGYVPENDFPRFDIGKLLHIGIVGHFWIEIGKNGRPLVVIRMFGIVDLKVFDGDPFRHITGIAEIMLTGIGTAY